MGTGYLRHRFNHLYDKISVGDVKVLFFT